MPTNAYTRLPGRRLNSLLGTTSLWLGSDHILKVTMAGYSEEYRRFYLADVRGFVIQRTSAMMSWIGVTGVLAVGLGLGGIALWSGGGTDAQVGGGIFIGLAVVSLILFVVNLIKGPSCDFYIKTAIQTDRIKSISRLKSAEALITALTPVVLAAQRGSAAAPVVEDAPVVEGPVA